MVPLSYYVYSWHGPLKEALRHTVSHCGLQVTNRHEMVIHSLQIELSMIFSNHIRHICIFLVIFIFAPFMASAQELNLSGIPDYGDESVEITTARMDMHAISMNHYGVQQRDQRR